MSEKTQVAEESTYDVEIIFQNGWGQTIKSLWIAYGSGEQSGVPRYFDKIDLNVSVNNTVEIGKVISRKGKSDWWTVTFLGNDGELWGTPVLYHCDLPNANGEVQIEAVRMSKEIQIVSERGTHSQGLVRL